MAHRHLVVMAEDTIMAVIIEVMKEIIPHVIKVMLIDNMKEVDQTSHCHQDHHHVSRP